MTRDEISRYQEDPRSQKRDLGHPHLVKMATFPDL
jgi:hypothetical protein